MNGGFLGIDVPKADGTVARLESLGLDVERLLERSKDDSLARWVSISFEIRTPTSST